MEEQIEEMDTILREIFGCQFAYKINFEKYGGFGGHKEIYTEDIAEFLYNAGYRKQSENTIELPCKVGDTLYVLSQMKDKRILPFISTYGVTSISIRKKSIIVYHEMDGYIKIFKQTDFGKTVFLTQEEAKKSLAKMKGGAE